MQPQNKGGGTKADQIGGTLSGPVREKLKEKERRKASVAIREVLPFDLTGLLGQAAEGTPIQHANFNDQAPRGSSDGDRRFGIPYGVYA